MNIISEKLKNLIGIKAIFREGHKMAKTEGKPSLINILVWVTVILNKMMLMTSKCLKR